MFHRPFCDSCKLRGGTDDGKTRVYLEMHYKCRYGYLGKQNTSIARASSGSLFGSLLLADLLFQSLLFGFFQPDHGDFL